jgi:hypothetical protein
MTKPLPLVSFAFAAPLLGLVSAGSALGQNVLVVADAGPYTTVQSAIDAALEGDVILVRTRTWGGFVIDAKSLTVVDDSQSLPPGGTWTFVGEVKNLAASQSVSIRGFRPAAAGGVTRLAFGGCAGPVLVEDCVLDNFNNTLPSFFQQEQAAGVYNCASVTFRNCTLRGSIPSSSVPTQVGGNGLYIVGSQVVVVDCTLTGGQGSFGFPVAPGAGGHGAHVDWGSSLWALQSTFKGGQGGFAPGAINPSGAGGDGLHAEASATLVTLVSCTAIPGPPGVSNATPPLYGPPGDDLDVQCPLQQTTTAVKRFAAASPVHETGALQFDAECGAVNILYLFGADRPGNALFVAGVEGALLFDLASSWVIELTGGTPCSGQVSYSFPVPPNVPALEALTFTVQPLFTDSSFSTLFLGAPSTFAILDSVY